MATLTPQSGERRFFRRKQEDHLAALSTSRTLISYLERRRLSVRLVLGGITLLLLVGVLSFLFPLLWLFIGSVKSNPELASYPPTLLPKLPTVTSYAEAWNNINFPHYFGNTLLIVAGGWFIPMTVNLLAAYSLSKLRPSYGHIVWFGFLLTMMVPGVVYLIPVYIIVVNLGLHNTWLSLWLPGAFSAYSILIAKSFFDAIPNELNDSAVIDGANAFHILWHIILPLSKPLIVVLSIGSLIGNWQQFFAPFLYITDNQWWPIGTELYSAFLHIPHKNAQLAALVITALPPIIFFAIFQRQVIRGINLSGFMTG